MIIEMFYDTKLKKGEIIAAPLTPELKQWVSVKVVGVTECGKCKNGEPLYCAKIKGSARYLGVMRRTFKHISEQEITDGKIIYGKPYYLQ